MKKQSSLRKGGVVRFTVPDYVRSTVHSYLSRLPEGRGFVIGGWARNLLSLVIGGQFVEEISSDVDLLVIGSECPELEGVDVQTASSLDAYFGSRDLTANQVAISSEEIIATRKAVLDHLNGRIRLVGFGSDLWEEGGKLIPSPRVSFRAARFAAHFGLECPRLPSWEYRFDGALQGWKALQKSPAEFERYLHLTGGYLESFVTEVQFSGLRETNEFLETLYSLYPWL